MTQDDNYLADRGLPDIRGSFKITTDGVARVSKTANVIADALSLKGGFLSSAAPVRSPAAQPKSDLPDPEAARESREWRRAHLEGRQFGFVYKD